MPTNESEPIEVGVRIEAPPEAVFAFLTDESKLMRWLADNVRADARPNGEFRIEASGGEVVSGRYVEVVANEKVVFTWGWESMFPNILPGSTTVEISLTPDGDGTIVKLRHYNLPSDAAGQHQKVWKQCLEKLRQCWTS